MIAVLPADGPDTLARAVAALQAGEVVVVPTDTIYGVAVDARVPGATDRLFAAKHRPREVVLPVLVGDPDDVDGLAVVTDPARSLMAAHWPGALTVVLERRAGVALDLGADDATIGIRCPAHPFTRELCRVVGPLAVTSANRHGEATPDTAGGVAAELGDAVALVVDDGPAPGGVSSTVVDCTQWPVRILREGAIPASAIEGVIRSG